MVKHIILWQLKEELSEQKKQEIKAEIKKGLEGLDGKVEGLKEIHVYTDALPSSNADLMLECILKDEQALSAYGVHPDHVKIKDELIMPHVKSRVCFDFEVL